MSPLLLIPVTYLAAVCQMWFGARYEITGAAPDLLALTAFVWLIVYGGSRGFVMAALVGLTCDLGNSVPLGINMAVYGIVGYAVLWLRRQISIDRIAAQLCLLWLAVTTVSLAEGVIAVCRQETNVSLQLLIERIAAVGLYTTLAAVPILLIIYWRCNKRPSLNLSTTAVSR